MADLIERQAVLSGAVSLRLFDRDVKIVAVDYIESLPSAEKRTEEHTETHACDCISRQAAIDALGEEPEVWSEKDDYAQGLNNQWNSDIDALKDLPPAQPERKTGRWIYDNEAYPGGNPYGHYDCDQCGESVPHKTNFCPNCGAKMEVEHERR